MAQPRTFEEVAALYNSGRLTDAEAAGQLLVAARPGDAAAHNLLAVILAQQGKPASAADLFRKAGALNAGWDEPYANLGLLQMQQRDFAGATASLREALKRKPDNPATAINLGNALKETGALDEAADSYRRALGPGPHQAAAYSNLGALLFDRDLPEAVACFRRATEIQPGFAAAQLNLGRGLFQLGNLEEAVAALKRAAELTPQASEAHVMLANALRDLGRAEEALQSYRRAVELKPDDREAAYNFGLMLNQRGRHAEGLTAIAKGPGLVALSLAPQASPPRVEIPGSEIPRGPHFIGAWKMADAGVCDDLIGWFEARGAEHFSGRSAKGLDTTVKNSTDLSISPADLHSPGFEPVKAYLRHLEACAADYARAWPHFASMFSHVDVVPFNIQRYLPGGHFQRVHAERMSFAYIHRVMAWMTYLNDVEDGGETVFDHYGIAVKPVRGQTLIWPAEWTHAHHGAVVKSGRKYVITGWMHFPHPR